MLILNFEFVWSNLIFAPQGGVKVGVIQNEFLQTWSCYLYRRKANLKADFEF